MSESEFTREGATASTPSGLHQQQQQQQQLQDGSGSTDSNEGRVPTPGNFAASATTASLSSASADSNETEETAGLAAAVGSADSSGNAGAASTAKSFVPYSTRGDKGWIKTKTPYADKVRYYLADIMFVLT